MDFEDTLYHDVQKHYGLGKVYTLTETQTTGGGFKVIVVHENNEDVFVFDGPLADMVKEVYGNPSL
jgi:hypothetical protein